MPDTRWSRILERLGRLFTRKGIRPTGEHPPEGTLRLPDGTPVIVRPIEPNDAQSLVQALSQLSAQSRYQRFLSYVERLTPAQVEYLTHPDGVNHLALGMAVWRPHGQTPQPIAIARCIRDEHDRELAEVAVVVADEWQRRGVGALLLGRLAEEARRAGIERWKAEMLAENTGVIKLLSRVAVLEARRLDGPVMEAIYRL